MAPFVPYHNSAGQSKIVIFGGLITTEFLEPPPGRCFMFRQTYRHDVEGPVPDNLRRLIDSPNRPKGPPLHFHQFQTEYLQVESGIMGISVDGVVKKVTADDGEMTVKAGSIHQFFIHPESPGPMTFCASAADSGIDYQIDRVFFENWYGYWHDALLHDGGLNLIQYLTITDAGDMYTPAPWWVPFFRREIGYWTCVFLGRWVGGLLGYKPFFKEYTTDWAFAVAKMKGSWFQRHLVQDAFSVQKPWEELKKMEFLTKPLSGDFEPYTTDLAKGKPQRAIRPVNGVNGSGKHDLANGDEGFTKVNGDVNGATGIESLKESYQMRERSKQGLKHQD